MYKLALVLPIALCLAACAGEPPAPPADTVVKADTDVKPVTPPPAPMLDDAGKAAVVAVAVDKDPTHAADALKAANMTQADLDALMYNIAQDPKLTEEYNTARKASGIPAAPVEPAPATPAPTATPTPKAG